MALMYAEVNVWSNHGPIGIGISKGCLVYLLHLVDALSIDEVFILMYKCKCKYDVTCKCICIEACHETTLGIKQHPSTRLM